MRDPSTKLRTSGFTIIEILIAVAIIAVLIGFIIPNFLGIRVRARDVRRKSDLAQMQKALELYEADQDSASYPDDTFMDGLCSSCWSQSPGCAGNIYMRKLPCDPQDQSQYLYVRDPADSLRYSLTACLENESDPDKDPSADATCAGLGKQSYTINEP